MILSRDVARTVKFFNAGLQLPIVFASPTMTELDAGSGFPLIVRGTETCVAPPLLQAARSRAPLTTTTPLSPIVTGLLAPSKLLNQWNAALCCVALLRSIL